MYLVFYYFFLLFFFYKRGYSLIGKTANLHFVNLGSSPDISISYQRFYIKAREAQLVERNTEDV